MKFSQAFIEIHSLNAFAVKCCQMAIGLDHQTKDS